MKSLVPYTLTSALACLAATMSASAYNITINDLQAPNAPGWHANGKGQGGEDQETEPGTAPGQDWDLEAFTLNGKKLTIYSGYNLLAGNKPYGLGDLFIDTNGDAHWQPGADNHINGKTDNSVFLYDYVVHFTKRSGFSIGDGSYTVYQIDNSKSVVLTETVFKSGSNPWILDTDKSSKDHIKAISSGQLGVTVNNTATLTIDGGTQVTGGTHYMGDLDVSFLPTGDLANGKTIFHITMQCGNDSLVGRVADGGATLTLLGAAMTTLAFLVRRQGKK
ncbi:MAG: hypothetical protein HY299_05540 [Verrucomicrobia bacterium]|nr:hypothetical protein [Verrucomicrobiota bacterium]